MSWVLTTFKCVLFTLNNLFLVLSRSLNYLLQPTLHSYLFAKSKEFNHFQVLDMSGINALYISNVFCNYGKCLITKKEPFSSNIAFIQYALELNSIMC